MVFRYRNKIKFETLHWFKVFADLYLIKPFKSIFCCKKQTPQYWLQPPGSNAWYKYFLNVLLISNNGEIMVSRSGP